MGGVSVDVDLQVMRIVAEALGISPGEVRLESRMFDDLGADSLAAEDVIQALEKSFGVAIPPDAAAEIETVRDLAERVKQLRGMRS